MLLMIFMLIMIIVLSFKFKEKVIRKKTGNDGTKEFEIMVLLKYLRIFEEPLKCH